MRRGPLPPCRPSSPRAADGVLPGAGRQDAALPALFLTDDADGQRCFAATGDARLTDAGPRVGRLSAFALYPMVDVILMSFREWSGLTAERPWVGWENYRYITTQDPVFWVAFRNTIVWNHRGRHHPEPDRVRLALALNQNLPGRSPLRVIYYLPVIIASIAVATIWKWMYDPFFGLFNEILMQAGPAPLDPRLAG